jgi:hypothetical protein
MALIRSFRDVPPGGWRYVQPETGVHFSSDTFDGLVEKIRPHRVYKGLGTENLELEVQRQLCAGLTEQECRPEPDEDYHPVRDLTARLTTQMALGLTKAITSSLLEVASGNAVLVSREEAQARASVCRGCPFNKPASLCSCSAVYRAIEAAIPRDRIVDGVSVCMACGCSLQAKINLPLSVVRASNASEVSFPAWCWQTGLGHLADGGIPDKNRAPDGKTPSQPASRSGGAPNP